MKMPWSQMRLVAYWLVGTMLLVTSVVFASVPIERAPKPLLVAFSLLAGLMALMVVVDVAYHAWLGQGQACPYCGHVRKMKSFRVHVTCPQCGR